MIRVGIAMEKGEVPQSTTTMTSEKGSKSCTEYVDTISIGYSRRKSRINRIGKPKQFVHNCTDFSPQRHETMGENPESLYEIQEKLGQG